METERDDESALERPEPGGGGGASQAAASGAQRQAPERAARRLYFMHIAKTANGSVWTKVYRWNRPRGDQRSSRSSLVPAPRARAEGTPGCQGMSLSE